MNFFDPGWVAGGIFLFTVINIVLLIYTAYIKIDEFEQHFKTSEWILKNKILWAEGGVLVRLHRLNVFTIILQAPKLCHKRGGLDLDEYHCFPKPLMRWITCLTISKTLNISALFLFWLWAKKLFPFNI